MDVEQRVRARADAIQAVNGMHIGTCIAIARAELEREGKLVAALRDANTRLAYLGDVVSTPLVSRALNAYEAEFAPKPRTLKEVAKDVVENRQNGYAIICALDELAEALKREKETS